MALMLGSQICPNKSLVQIQIHGHRFHFLPFIHGGRDLLFSLKQVGFCKLQVHERMTEVSP